MRKLVILLVVSGILFVPSFMYSKNKKEGESKFREKMLDRIAERLELTDEQKEKISSLIKDSENKRKKIIKDLAQLTDSLKEALKNEAPDNELQDIIDKIKDEKNKMQSIDDELYDEASKILTTKQIAKFIVLKSERMKRMRMGKRLGYKDRGAIDRWRVEVENPEDRSLNMEEEKEEWTKEEEEEAIDRWQVETKSPGKKRHFTSEERDKERYEDLWGIDINLPRKRAFE
ncbi:MAG: Spy/CpxP family protein refolding chaperone [Candidatus Hydrogenedentota bacterium]